MRYINSHYITFHDSHDYSKTFNNCVQCIVLNKWCFLIDIPGKGIGVLAVVYVGVSSEYEYNLK